MKNTAYEQGREDQAAGTSYQSNPFAHSAFGQAMDWQNGFLDAEQSKITGRNCRIREA